MYGICLSVLMSAVAAAAAAAITCECVCLYERTNGANSLFSLAIDRAVSAV